MPLVCLLPTEELATNKVPDCEVEVVSATPLMMVSPLNSSLALLLLCSSEPEGVVGLTFACF